MSNQTINSNPTLHDMNTTAQNRTQSNPALRQVFKLGLDVDLHFAFTAIQCDQGAIALAQKFTRARLSDWIKEQVAAGHQVHTVYWNRFQHRKAIGSYTGCCPSQHSSGGVQRFGHIDRHGNKHVRVLLVEAVWRLLKPKSGKTSWARAI